MSEEQEKLIEAVEAALDRRDRIDHETHKKHHEFIDRYILEVERKQQMLEKVKSQVIGWGIIVTLSGFVTSIGYAVRQFIKGNS